MNVAAYARFKPIATLGHRVDPGHQVGIGIRVFQDADFCQVALCTPGSAVPYTGRQTAQIQSKTHHCE